MTTLLLTATLVLCKNPIPEFFLSASDGKTYSEKLFVKKPTLVVFLKQGCPCNLKVVEGLNKVSQSLKNSAQVVGFMNADIEMVKRESKEIGAKFLLIADPQSKVFVGCNVSGSLDFTVVATDDAPRYPKLWQGMSKATIDEGLEVIVKHGKKLAKWNSNALAKETLRGCPL